MALTFGEQARILVGKIHNMPIDEARRRINKSYRDNSEEHGWQHLLKRFTLQTEALYNTGTIAATNALTAVTGSGTTFVPSWVTAPSMRRIAIQGRSEPYDVSAIGGATSLTLADSYIGTTASGLTYSLFRDTYPLQSDCGMAKLMVLYDPTTKARLFNLNQPKFIAVRADNPTLTGIPECFTVIGLTSETPPRPQIQMYPAPSTVRAYHGWYFKRPALITSDASYLEWPEDFDEMISTRAILDFYREPKHYSPKYLAEFKPMYADMYNRMKSAMDGQSAIEFEIEEAQAGRGSGGWNPDVLGLSGESMVSW